MRNTYLGLSHTLQKPAPEIGAIGLNSTPDYGVTASVVYF